MRNALPRAGSLPDAPQKHRCAGGQEGVRFTTIFRTGVREIRQASVAIWELNAPLKIGICSPFHQITITLSPEITVATMLGAATLSPQDSESNDRGMN